MKIIFTNEEVREALSLRLRAMGLEAIPGRDEQRDSYTMEVRPLKSIYPIFGNEDDGHEISSILGN